MLAELAAQAGEEGGTLALPRLERNGSLIDALHRAAADGLPVLGELKRASPSAGPLLRGAADAYLAALRRGGAFALSIVTAGGRFAGDMQDLRRAHATRLPVLMKDFVTRPAQLDLAAHNGASAVLVIERLVGAERREALVRRAHDAGLEVLLEVHSGHEAAAAIASRADLLGVNSRDLERLDVDPAAARDLVRSIARERPCLLLSGVAGPRDAESARAADAAGVLVGTALLRHRDPALLVRALRRPLAKVCGNRTAADVGAARGADLVGVIVDTDSPRNVALEDARLLLAQARAQGAAAVAVTRLRPGSDLAALAHSLRPDYVQVHGALQPAHVATLHAAGVGVIQAVTPGQAPLDGADVVVTDTTAKGGSGRPHGAAVPEARLALVAGGLDASSAPSAIAGSGAGGADASSRLETVGRKDPGKVAAYVAAVHASQRRAHGA